MPVVLRSRIKEEGEGDAVSRSSSPKPLARRIKRRKRNSENDDDEFSGSDEYSGHLHGTVGNSRPFEMIGGLPSSLGVPQYNSALMHPLSVKDSAVLYYSLVSSRKTWVRGEMFELYFTKAAKPAKDQANTTDGASPTLTVPVRDKMQKMCDCTMLGGPHIFPTRLFILKDEEMERKWQDEQDMKKKEKEEARRRGKEEKQRLAEMKKQMQLQKKQEREKLNQLRKESKAKARVEQEAMKQRRKDEIKKVKDDVKGIKRTGSIPTNSSMTKPSASSSQSVTNPKMIANLNLMAQRDAKLNALMGIVANGDATLEQVEEFKKFIEIAKNMPPPPGWTPPPQPVQHTLREEENTSATNPKENDSNEPDTGFGIKSDTQHINKDETKRMAKKEPNSSEFAATKSEEDLKKRIGYSQHSENNSDEKSMQLTAFQQKYVQGAQIILEYTEYTTSRFLLPKKAVVEFVEGDGSFLFSWIMVHNEAEIRRHRTKRIRELSKGMKTEQEKEELAKNYDVYSERGCPTPLYTPMTVKFTGIHRKFARILSNSVDPLEKVQKEMTTVMEMGTRLSGYNMWYQLDAYDDKDLAESLRVKLNEHEEESKGRKHRQ